MEYKIGGVNFLSGQAVNTGVRKQEELPLTQGDIFNFNGADPIENAIPSKTDLINITGIKISQKDNNSAVPLNYSEKWVYKSNGLASSPVIDSEGGVCFGTSDGVFQSLDPKTGEVKWKTNIGQNLNWSNASTGKEGQVFAAGGNGILYAFDGKTGENTWRFEYEDNMFSSPKAGPGGKVYVAGMDGKFAALDAKTGEVKWQKNLEGIALSTPAFKDDKTVYIGTNSDKVIAFDGATGDVKWEAAAGPFPAIHAGDNGNIYCTDRNGNINCFNEEDGKTKWSGKLGEETEFPPVSDGKGNLFIGGNKGKLYCLDENTGKVKWAQNTGSMVITVPVINEDGSVFVGNLNKEALVIDGKNGDIKSKFALDDYPDHFPTQGPDKSVYMSSGKSLHAFQGE